MYKGMYITIAIGVEMPRSECEKWLRYEGSTFDDYDTEEEAYSAAACNKYSEGLGADVERLTGYYD